jgi:hypothetical protein
MVLVKANNQSGERKTLAQHAIFTFGGGFPPQTANNIPNDIHHFYIGALLAGGLQ